MDSMQAPAVYEEGKQRKNWQRRLTAVMTAVMVLVIVAVVVSRGMTNDHEQQLHKNPFIHVETPKDALQVQPEVAVSGDYQIPTMSCTAQWGIDLPGHDIKYIKGVTSLAGCQNYCKLNMECRCYVWHSVFKECWLKNGPCDIIGRGNQVSYNREMVTGLCRGLNRKCTKNSNTDLPGNDLYHYTGSTSYLMEECAKSCRQNLDCNCYVRKSISYSQSICWLKKGGCDNFVYRPGFTSGSCDGGGSSTCPA